MEIVINDKEAVEKIIKVIDKPTIYNKDPKYKVITLDETKYKEQK